MTSLLALAGARIFDGAAWHDGKALLVEDGHIAGIGPVPTGAPVVHLDGGMLVPGFIDLQVNGGGGALLNEVATLQGIRTVCSAHRPFGTTTLMPTMVTDAPHVVSAVIAAGIAATKAKVPGFLGLHLEGPHLSVARKGAHDPALIRPMTESDLNELLAARRALPNLICTVAAETVTPDQIARLSAGGIVVSIGHSDASYAAVSAAARAGATMATHLFNAMSQIGNREPGVAGAVLDTPGMHAGLIADGIHVHPATIGIALRAKSGPGHLFLVSDAMSVAGTNATSFVMNGRTVHRADGALRLADGTLAGADLTMIGALAYMHRTIGLPLDEALRMASLYPAQALGVADALGHLGQGARANLVHLGDDLGVRASWIDGAPAHTA
jgi:N-acetylglucosamine-6-phosphate deacetylase